MRYIADHEYFAVAFAGLVYLSLILAAKFSVTIPFLAPAPFQESAPQHSAPRTSPRSQAAAPPLHLFVLVFVPIGAAIYIASTRYTDYKHHGFDVLFSSLEGTVCAWFAFRCYHMPIRRGAGWAWGPRSNDRAFGIAIGTGTYHQPKSRSGAQDKGKAIQEDVERGGSVHHPNRGPDEIELVSNSTFTSEGQTSVRHILGSSRS